MQMSLAVGSGGHGVYLPAGGFGGASASPFSTLMGRPVIPIEQCQTCGTSGDIILASFGKGYIFSQKGSLQSDLSIHTHFVFDESCLRFVLRLDSQPVLRAPVTPYKGTNTQSYFLKLDTRS